MIKICSSRKYKDKENQCGAKCMKKDEEHAEEENYDTKKEDD